MDWVPSAVWLVLLLLFSVWEAATVALVSVWFAAGALAALIASAFTADLWLQLAVFLAVSAVTLALVRPLARKRVLPRFVPTNADRVIGRQGVVSEKVDNLAATGVVTVAGMAWTARSEQGEPIPAGTAVTVCRIEGVKLFVTPVKQ